MVSHCVLICISLVTEDIAQLYKYLIGCLNVLFDGPPFQYFAHFSIVLFLFFLSLQFFEYSGY